MLHISWVMVKKEVNNSGVSSVSNMLTGLTVLVTRPKEQAKKLAEKIAEAGGRPVIFPTLEIVSVEPDGGWETVQSKLNASDIVVFTSANAVREIVFHQIKIPKECGIAAIGTATQQALIEAGVISHWIPMSDFRSEGLLELPVFQEIKNKKIIIMSGEGGREYLQDILKERGAYVEKIAVYKRVCPISDVSPLKEFIERSGSRIIVSTSVESLDNFLVLSAGAGKPFDISLLVVSHRMREVALAKGFQYVLVASNASDEAILKGIAEFK